ncbi:MULTISPECIES: FAD-dependent oxidoreductase [unclassified Beijerinckia]|uniref:NAD(P)/FAD-dependent oxidoreductase n=1 Tax=unclassified Beijerinckia TaxID=2638183 RepID=UPI000897AE11|nr:MULTISPECIES: FAD-dependent oxidoreductase [unclassified Beijerinckia]MDH7795373.1 putative NAD/FAD-binding protein [Beijerinckia sp. GAS462]SEB98818.1 hypothetical protein SAMN05443249_1646 [Beijerinckia sp. 28-YEA-48]
MNAHVAPPLSRAAGLKIAIVGTGISGMSAAWLLATRHQVTVYEQDGRIGGHSNTRDAPTHNGSIPVDTGFIVYNEKTYPNLTALFSHLDVTTQESDMSFSASLHNGEIEYSGENLASLFAQRSNLLRPRFWSMLYDLQRFYRQASRDSRHHLLADLSLGEYLDKGAYGAAFRDDHLLPLAAAIWSAPARRILDYPAASFIRFQENHGLLNIFKRPIWRTVSGGSRAYVEKLTRGYADRIRRNAAVVSVVRHDDHVEIIDATGQRDCFDHVILATHADQALKLIDTPTLPERELLSAFRYSHNIAYLHRDTSLMPRRRNVWASWNYLDLRTENELDCLTVTYWMNKLQGIDPAHPLFVTLNPARPPEADKQISQEFYEHPTFDTEAIAAQKQLWSLQGQGNVWFCGAYMGAGFHEDGLQAGLAVAEAIGGVRRPWQVENESSRIGLPDGWEVEVKELAA